MCPHGLWLNSIDHYLDNMRQLGFNSIRLPFSEKTVIHMDHLVRTECVQSDMSNTTVRQMFHLLLSKTKARNMTVLLDFHVIHDRITESPIDKDFTQTQFIETWDAILFEYSHYQNILGVDIKNEPHGPVRWTTWAQFCREFIYTIHNKHPDFKGMFFIEGLEDPYDASAWGGSFRRMGRYLRTPPLSDRVVFSPHLYGVSVRGETALNNMDFHMQEWFGFIIDVFPNPVVIGEIGGYNIDSDLTWHQHVKTFLIERGIIDFYYWAWNPDSFDTNGILENDWSTINWSKVQFCTDLQANPSFPSFQ